MDANELARWTRFAAKGGIGKCTAIVDCIAQEMGEDLMFLKEDEITVLMQLPEPGVYLGHCEGVVGRFSGKDVRFHGKLKKPIMAKRGSVTVGTAGTESRMSVSLVEKSRAEHSGELRPRSSESPSSPRSGSRIKQTPSPSQSKSQVHTQLGSMSYSRYSDQSTTAIPDSRSSVMASTSPTSFQMGRSPSNHTGHAKPPQMLTSISGASIFSVGSASIYSEASTATSASSSTDGAFDRIGSKEASVYPVNSNETGKRVPDGNVNQASNPSDSQKPAFPTVSMSDRILAAAPSVSELTSNAMLSASESTLPSMSTSASEVSFASTSTYDPDSGSLGSFGSISELEEKQFDMSKFSIREENFVLVAPPLGMGGRNDKASPVVAPLRVSKSPRPSPSPGPSLSSPSTISLNENPRSTSISPALPSPLSPGNPMSLISRPPTSPSLGFPGSLSPGLPGSLTPGQRSPGLPGSLSPGFRFGRPHGSNSLSQYTFASGSSSPNPYPSPHGSTPSPTLTNPYLGVRSGSNEDSVRILKARTSSMSSSSYTIGSAPLSPPPSAPLPPLPAASLPSPAFSPVPLPTSTSASTIGTAATAAASGRMSPLAALTSSLPSSTSSHLYPGDQHGQRDLNGNEDGLGHGNENGIWDEEEESNVAGLSTLDAFRRRLDDSADEDEIESSEDEGEHILRLGEKEEKMGRVENEEGAEIHSDGEIGIGLSLMGELGSEDDEDEDDEDVAKRASKTSGGNDKDSSTDDERVDTNQSVPDATSGNPRTMALAWTRYSPMSPVSIKGSARGHQTGEEESGDGGDEDEDDGTYWDDIYDDYRYSRYSLGSKRLSITSKASGASKASSRARANPPPVPIPPDWSGADTPRQSGDGSDGSNGNRPSLESTSSAMSITRQFSRPSLIRTASAESTQTTHTLPLTAQFPAVPAHVPVRTGSRLRIVHGLNMQSSDDHEEQEQQQKPTEEVELNIKVDEVTEEDEAQGQELDIGRQFTFANANTALSPLLHTTFGSPHSSRFTTDCEDGSDQDHARRYSNKSGKSAMSSAEGPPKSPVDGGGMSALKVGVETHHVQSSEAAPSLVTQISAFNLLGKDLGMRVDDNEGGATGINITVSDPVVAAEVASPLPVSPSQSTSGVRPAVATDPAQATSLEDSSEVTEKSAFLGLRPQPSSPSPHPFVRTSMFLPHPNAPKAVHHQSQGPMYGRTTTQAYAYPVASRAGMGSPALLPSPPGATFFSIHILHQLRSLTVAVPHGPARRPPMTLFARCQIELNTSMGPVPILFSLDPFPARPMLPEGPHAQARVDGGKRAPYLASMTPMRAATVSALVRRGGDAAALNEGVGGVSGVGARNLGPLRLPRAEGPQGIDASLLSPGPSLPIPREGFIPQVGAARPRSRSFSSFDSRVPVPAPQRSHEEPVIQVQGASNVPTPPRKGFPPALVTRHALSPLILHGRNKDREPSDIPSSPTMVSTPSTQLKVPASPFPQESLTSPVVGTSMANGLDKDKDASPVPELSVIADQMVVSPVEPHSATSQLHVLMPGHQRLLDAPPNGSTEAAPRKSSDSSDSRSLTSPPLISEGATLQNARSSPSAQEAMLRSKLSLPALRMKASIRPNKMDDAVSVASLAASGENETVQVQDMDFELVKPSMPQVTPGRASQDSTMTGREVDVGKPEPSPVLGDTASTVSSAPRSPLAPNYATNTPTPTESAESIDAHRQRELKWMALFPSVSPSQARRNKKVRKLLQEGVPSSVRYLVWCHLTDSKARALPGVYAKLCKRPPVPMFAVIERDAVMEFPEHPQLHTAKGPLVSLLQAYLTMVPDIQYDSGLTSIAGHLLLLAPEEDAFWIFASMMDAHLRTYFATNAVQVEIDASLFSKALEVIDPVLTKKLYTQLSIAPANIIRPWFSTLFVGSLPADHLHRVWDIFLYEGMPYLFRVGLVVATCVRHLLLQATTEEAALTHLVHPPRACLPSATDLLALAANMKLKDDDIRKQRTKMEQQLKRTTQFRSPNGLSSVQTAAISLPKT